MDQMQPNSSISTHPQMSPTSFTDLAAEDTFDTMFTIRRTKSFWDEDAMDIDYDRDVVDATMAMLQNGSSGKVLMPQHSDCRDDTEDCAGVSDTGSAAADKNGIRCTLSGAVSHDTLHEQFYDTYLSGIQESSPLHSRSMMYMHSLLDDDTDAEEEVCFEETQFRADEDESSICTKRNYSFDDLVSREANPKEQEPASSLLSLSSLPGKKYSRSLSDTATVGVRNHHKSESMLLSSNDIVSSMSDLIKSQKQLLQHHEQAVHRVRKDNAVNARHYNSNADYGIDLYSSPTCVRKLSTREIILAQQQQQHLQEQQGGHLHLAFTESTVTFDDDTACASQETTPEWFAADNSSVVEEDRYSIQILGQDEIGEWIKHNR